MTRRLPATDVELAQMNLPLFEPAPMMLPEDKRRELTSALVDLLLEAAIHADAAAKQGEQSEPEEYVGPPEQASDRIHPTVVAGSGLTQSGESAAPVRSGRSRTQSGISLR